MIGIVRYRSVAISWGVEIDGKIVECNLDWHLIDRNRKHNVRAVRVGSIVELRPPHEGSPITSPFIVQVLDSKDVALAYQQPQTKEDLK